MARPRGAARGSASAILGMPEFAEKRTVTDTSCLKCNALLTLAASALGTNLPSKTTPLAWAARCVVCLPNAELIASTNDSGVVAIAGSVWFRRNLLQVPRGCRGVEAVSIGKKSEVRPSKFQCRRARKLGWSKRKFTCPAAEPEVAHAPSKPYYNACRQ